MGKAPVACPPLCDNRGGHATGALPTLQARAQILHTIRQFFLERGVLEVETPLLSPATVTDPYIISMTTFFQERGARDSETLYLQTSPEYAMKRLLANGSGSIFQLTKAFRQGDIGRHHSPEFTMLEWYRIGFDHHALMDEMDELLSLILKTPPAYRMTVQDAYQEYVNINPHTARASELIDCATRHGIDVSTDGREDTNFWLDVLFTQALEPHLGKDRPCFLYDFPVSQAALAKIRMDEDIPVASRFEVYFKGVELANGFHELQDVTEQRHRFENDLSVRQKNNIQLVPIDENFLNALEQGLPDCAGVALGVDRLIMLALKKNHIADIMIGIEAIL